jgi:DnaJ-class molecular chaperone
MCATFVSGEGVTELESQERYASTPTRVAIPNSSRRLHMRTFAVLSETSIHANGCAVTRSSLIRKSDTYTILVVRLVCRKVRAVWVVWILRYAYYVIPRGTIAYDFSQDLFSQLFGGGGGGFFGGGGGGGRSAGPRRTKDLVHRINVSLEDLYKGKTTKLALTRNVICNKCDGKGGKEGAVRTCGGCSGRGVRVTLRQMGPMIQQLQSTCDECSGTGEVINHKDKCKTCNGRKVVSEKKVLEVHIDKGMKGGQTITFHGESDQAPGASPGDVIIEINEKPHERFRRQGNDLLAEFEVDLLTALGGGQFAIKHLDDRALLVTIVPGEVIKHG